MSTSLAVRAGVEPAYLSDKTSITQVAQECQLQWVGWPVADIIGSMKMNRVWGNPTGDTFSSAPIGDLVRRYLRQSKVSVDPFARNKRWATYTNDLNPDTAAEWHLDALDFLQMLVERGVKADTILWDPPYCYDDQTDLLTADGWKSANNVNDQDAIATLNRETDTLEYQRPTAVIHQPYSGPMYKIEAQAVSLLVTPNHRLWIKNSYLGKYALVAVKDVGVKSIWFQKSCDLYAGSEQEYFVLPGVHLEQHNRYNENDKPPKQFQMDTWLKFLGLFLTEGCSFSLNGNPKRDCRISISQKKPEVRIIIEGILDELGYRYNKTGLDYRIQDKQLYCYLSKLGKAKEKYIPPEFKNLSQRQLGLLIDYMIMGDGTNSVGMKLNKTVNRYYPTRTHIYRTASVKLMDDFCEIAVKAGYAISVTRKTNDPTYNIRILGSKHFQVKTQDMSIVNDFSGMVHCVSVPNQIILVRRNGRIFWCGNSPSQMRELYDGFGLPMTPADVYRTCAWTEEKNLCHQLIPVGGYSLHFGWSTLGMGPGRGFVVEELLVVCHGSCHHDTLCLAERKAVERPRQLTIDLFPNEDGHGGEGEWQREQEAEAWVESVEGGLQDTQPD